MSIQYFDLIKNLIIKPNSIEEHTVYLEVEVEINCISYEEKEIQVIQDLYCPGERINYDLKTLKTTSDRKTLKNICQIREKVNVPEIGNGEIINPIKRAIIMASGLESRTRPVTDTTPYLLFDELIKLDKSYENIVNGGKKDE